MDHSASQPTKAPPPTTPRPPPPPPPPPLSRAPNQLAAPRSAPPTHLPRPHPTPPSKQHAEQVWPWPHPGPPGPFPTLPPEPWSSILQRLTAADHKALMRTCSAAHTAVASSAINHLRIKLSTHPNTAPPDTTLPAALTALTFISFEFVDPSTPTMAPFLSWFCRCYHRPLSSLRTLQLTVPQPIHDQLAQQLRQLLSRCSSLRRLDICTSMSIDWKNRPHCRYTLEEAQPGRGVQHLDTLFPSSSPPAQSQDGASAGGKASGKAVVGNQVLPNLPELLLQLTGLEVSNGYTFSEDQLQQLPSLTNLKLEDCFFGVWAPLTLPTTLKSLALRRCGAADVSSNGALGANAAPASAAAPDGNPANSVDCYLLFQHIDLAKLPLLENLSLQRCSGLDHLPSTISALQHLQTLRMDSCSVQALPDALGQLTNLKSLHINTCQNLAIVPDSLSGLSQLQLLELVSCGKLTELPGCVTHLSSLQTMLLAFMQFEGLPEGIGCLENLRHLRLHKCIELRELPEAIGQLSSLTALEIEEPSDELCVLPDSIAQLHQLQELYLVEWPSLSTLPDSIGDLSSLLTLNLQNCASLEWLPESIGALTALKTLNLQDCVALQELPESMVELKELTYLNLAGCLELQSLPKGIRNLPQLRTLDLDMCESLQQSDCDDEDS